MGVLTLFSMFKEGTTFMVAREKDEAGVVSVCCGGVMSGYLAISLPVFKASCALCVQCE